MSRKRPLSPNALTSTAIFQSAPLEDRASTFLALYSPSIPPRTLQSHESVASATHRVLAWRKPSAQRSLSSSQCLYDTGHDDDGEKYAGKRLEKLLDGMRVEGAVVVARWYGGVMLGPVRFTHIEQVAREAILKVASGPEGKHGKVEDNAAKKRKGEQNDEESRAKLVKTLQKRDESICALRVMLAEKKEAAAKRAGLQSVQVHKSPQKPPLDYGGMALPVLQRLEKARDATIGWILKEIDKAENKIETT